MNSIAFSACALTPPSTFQDMHYSPTVLLPVPLEPSILAGHDYRRALSHGFDAYFEEMYTWNEHRTDLVFVDRFYTLTRWPLTPSLKPLSAFGSGFSLVGFLRWP